MFCVLSCNSMDTKTILVIGATGHQGNAVIQALKKRPEFKIRGFVRDPRSKEAQALTRQGVELAQGDLDDFASLEKAMQGVYGVFSYQEDGEKDEEDRGKRVAHVAKLT